jgi:mono/diheme cytochrome c family protein
MYDFTKHGRTVVGLTAATVIGLAAFAMPAGPAMAADEKPRRSGPPPIVFTEFPNQCARCHKADGRGGPAYGGFAADLRATLLDHDGLVYVITVGIRDRGMPEFKSTMSKREIAGIATYIEEHIKGVYFDDAGNRITAEEAAQLDGPRRAVSQE